MRKISLLLCSVVFGSQLSYAVSNNPGLNTNYGRCIITDTLMDVETQYEKISVPDSFEYLACTCLQNYYSLTQYCSDYAELSNVFSVTVNAMNDKIAALNYALKTIIDSNADPEARSVMRNACKNLSLALYEGVKSIDSMNEMCKKNIENNKSILRILSPVSKSAVVNYSRTFKPLFLVINALYTAISDCESLRNKFKTVYEVIYKKVIPELYKLQKVIPELNTLQKEINTNCRKVCNPKDDGDSESKALSVKSVKLAILNLEPFFTKLKNKITGVKNYRDTIYLFNNMFCRYLNILWALNFKF